MEEGLYLDCHSRWGIRTNNYYLVSKNDCVSIIMRFLIKNQINNANKAMFVCVELGRVLSKMLDQ